MNPLKADDVGGAWDDVLVVTVEDFDGSDRARVKADRHTVGYHRVRLFPDLDSFP